MKIDNEESKFEKLISSLKQRNTEAFVYDTKEDAKQAIIKMLNKEELIAFGGSTTSKQVGIVDYVINNGYKVLNRYNKNITKIEKKEIERKSLLSDVFITGSNAITLDGELINIDHTGNRVSAMLFGPRKVFVLVGTNKLVNSINDGIKRAKYIAAPLNAVRAKNEYNPPCLKDGKCVDCNFDETICNSLVIIRRQSVRNRMKIFIIKENLGF